MAEERRNIPRYACELTGSIHGGESFSLINIVNINGQGAEIISRTPLSSGSEFSIKMNVGEEEINCRCTVTWFMNKNEEYIGGVRFEDVSEEFIKERLIQADIIPDTHDSSVYDERQEMFDNVFESYHDEIFLRRAGEFVNYICENEPEKCEWARDILKSMTDNLADAKKAFEKWTKGQE